MIERQRRNPETRTKEEQQYGNHISGPRGTKTQQCKRKKNQHFLHLQTENRKQNSRQRIREQKSETEGKCSILETISPGFPRHEDDVKRSNMS